MYKMQRPHSFFSPRLLRQDTTTQVLVSGRDFSQGTLEECYVVHNSKAVVVMADAFAAPDKETIKQIINDVIEKLRT